MPINPSTEIIHPELGPIRFENGEAIPNVAGSKRHKPQWVCRPDGWDNWGFEIYIPGDSKSPELLDRAIAALRHRQQIESEGIQLSRANIELAWIDVTVDPATVAFPSNDDSYEIWRGQLDENWRIINLVEGAW
jgi:hypothetical protein